MSTQMDWDDDGRRLHFDNDGSSRGGVFLLSGSDVGIVSDLAKALG